MLDRGTVLDHKFEVLDKVGEGGMATVFRGRHTTLGRDVAIKVLHSHLSSSDKNRERFEREARAIERLHHPNILKIFDYSGRDSERAFIVTEFIDGPTLRALLDDVGAMMPEPAALVLRAVLAALDVAHRAGIVHRDVKPENVMIDRSGDVKLMDFGIARTLTDAQVTMTGALVGSPAYMSPEQATDGDLDARSDLFSLGAMAYRMVTGTLPFRGGNPSVVLKAIIDGVYEDPMARVPSLDPAFAIFVRRCLERDPAKRYRDASEARAALDAFLGGVGIDPDRPGEWSVAAYVADPEPYEDRLRSSLIATLVARGRAETQRGDSQAALRAFQRVLALDEENAEVVRIVSEMRRPEERRRRFAWLVWATPVVSLALFAGLYFGPARQRPGGPLDLPPVALVPMLAVPLAERPDPSELVRAPEPTPEETEEPPTPALRTIVRAPLPLALPTREEVAIRDPTPAPVVEAPCEGGNDVRIAHRDQNFSRFRVDGGPTMTTPKVLHLPAGTHEIELLGDEYKLREVLTIRVCGGTPMQEPELKSRWKPSVVRLAGHPEDAVVSLDGRVLGAVRDHRTLQLTEQRRYVVRIAFGDQVIDERAISVGFEDGRGDLLPGQSRDLTLGP